MSSRDPEQQKADEEEKRLGMTVLRILLGFFWPLILCTVLGVILIVFLILIGQLDPALVWTSILNRLDEFARWLPGED